MKCFWKNQSVSLKVSPSMRREWIEIIQLTVVVNIQLVSLHAEGVD